MHNAIIQITRAFFVLSFLTCEPNFAFSQNHDDRIQNLEYLKFSIYPMTWAASKKNVWLTMHYEGKIKNNFTYNLVADYYNWTYKIYLAGISGAVTNNQIFYFRPQVRLYLSKKVFNGYYVSLFPHYHYRELRYEKKYGHYYGGGILTGYQFFLRKKYPFEMNAWWAIHRGVFNKYDFATQKRNSGWENFGQLSFELNFGWPLKRSKPIK